MINFKILGLLFFNSILIYASDSLPGDSIYHVADDWKNQFAQTVKLKSLEGQYVVMAMVYTSCQHTCPIITEKLKRIQSGLSKNKKQKVHFVLVSFDPERDTPAVLKKHYDKHELSPKWSLLTGTLSGVRKLAAILGVNFKKESNGDFSHSNIISLLSPKGVILKQVKSLNEDTKVIENEIK